MMYQVSFTNTTEVFQLTEGGCGSMFAISVISPQFKGQSMIKQHRMVNAALADEIKKWHGLQLVTKALE